MGTNVIKQQFRKIKLNQKKNINVQKKKKSCPNDELSQSLLCHIWLQKSWLISTRDVSNYFPPGEMRCGLDG